MNEIEMNATEIEQLEQEELSIDREVDEDEQGDQEVQMTLTLEQIVDQIIEASKKTEFTLYALSVILNKTLEAIDAQKDGADYSVRSQMMYQYNKNKLVAKDAQGKGVKVDGLVTLAQARAFIIRFSAKFVK